MQWPLVLVTTRMLMKRERIAWSHLMSVTLPSVLCAPRDRSSRQEVCECASLVHFSLRVYCSHLSSDPPTPFKNVQFAPESRDWSWCWVWQISLQNWCWPGKSARAQINKQINAPPAAPTQKSRNINTELFRFQSGNDCLFFFFKPLQTLKWCLFTSRSYK